MVAPTYLLTKMAITTRLTDFVLQQHTFFQAAQLFACLRQLVTPIDDQGFLDLVLPTCTSSHQIPISPKHPPSYERHGRAQPLGIYMLLTVLVIE